jgi:NADPH2:quinone reductase
MKAIVCEQFGPIDQLVHRDMPDPEPGPGQVVLSVRAAGLNFADALLVQGLYQARPGFPFVPGAELAGEVLSVGEGVIGLKPGDRVMGMSPVYGAYAERVALPAANLLPVPAWLGFDEAAGLLYGHGTSHHALKQRAALRPGETLLVLGAAGGVGLAAVQIGKAMGARVIAGCSSADKLELARANGAELLIDYSRQDLRTALKELTDGKGVDVVYDPLGGDAFDACTRCMARNGRLLVIGFASGRIPQFPVNLALLKEYSVVGVFWGNFTRNEPAVWAENMRELLEWRREGKVHVEVTERLPLHHAPAALQRLVSRQAKGKLVLVPG